MKTPTRILKLNDQLSNQIAAGEVVERPSAALKELMENSLDAGALSLRVSIADGGMQLLEVADDGHGIHPEDLRLALDRHATSKIRQTEDLFAIKSWGFRGEALASIGAVSRLTLSSRALGEATGRSILCEGGHIREEKTIARPQGTTVRVEELFFNTPARKKFLKSSSAETSQCTQTFQRLALGCPHAAMEFTINGERAYHFSAAATMETRITDVFRAAWKLDLEEKDLMKVEAASFPLAMKAWILPSKHYIPSSRGILCYVNGRTVKDKLLQSAILAAARETLFGSLYPQMVLFLETPPEAVDVNVHPTKAEVRFREPGHVFGFVRKYLERALAGDRRGSVSLTEFEAPPSPASLFDRPQDTHLFQSNAAFHQKSAHGDAPAWGSLSSGTQNALLPPGYPALSESLAGTVTPYAPAFTPGPHANLSRPQFLGTLKNTYLICQDADGLLLVDQHAAHERVTYERLKKNRLEGESAALLIPIQIELGREVLDRMEGDFPKLAELGLQVDRTGPTLLAVRSLPSLLLKKDGAPALGLGNFFRKVSSGWDSLANEGDLAEAVRDKMLEALATESCHGSVRAGQTLSAPEAMALLEQMADTDFSGHCPHGRPTTVRFRWGEIERLFKRVF
ncbi:MAG: DNA mismatch repair endonuclease MutL [Proteobacteria bacterium]|nr:MAG: DNA mismatch repair endonuclease MutL [Pseudomonadota bacterium]